MKRLLFISHCVPYPPDKGERIRAYHELLALGRDFRVTLACLSSRRDDAAVVGRLAACCEEVLYARVGGRRGLLRGAIAMLSGRSVTEGFFGNARLKRWLKDSRRRTFDLVFGYCSAVLPYVLAAPAGARVMDLVDMDSLKWRGYAERSGRFRAWGYRREARGVAALERRAAASCDAVICISQAEAREGIGHAEKLHVVPNGVDTRYFSPGPAAAGAPGSLVFVGSMSYRPNVEAVCWFAANVWPVLKARLHSLRFQIVGRDPAPAVRRLAALPGVAVTGSVRDVRPYLSSACVAIAPLQMTRGVPNKVLEAMAMARPVIASGAALEGLDVSEGDGVLRAETPAQWQRTLLNLLSDPDRRARLGRKARRLVLRKYDWAACMSPLRSLCRRVVQRSVSPAAPAVRRTATPPNLRARGSVATLANPQGGQA
ncbi:MAG TPA: TIGR03087 family PEP-CTERM/XrtA system glycosyltransferase [Phycisphaerae bacterium]|nr:TIGR03087 family PEP-CTERM/XrtA system glycosyltransferase [Phycisphaerae bacterium]